MTLTQQEADRIQAKYEDKIAGYVGIPLPDDVNVIVLTQAEFDAKFPKDAGDPAAAGGHTAYIVDTADLERAKELITYETAHGMIFGQNMNAGTTQGQHGLIGTPAGKASEALAGVIVNRLGLHPTGWTPKPGAQTKLNNLSDTQLTAAASSIADGSFTSVNDIANADTPAGATGATGTSTDTGAGGNAPAAGTPEDIVTRLTQLMGGFLTGKFQWDSLDPKIQDSVMTLARQQFTPEQLKSILDGVKAREPNAPPEAIANDARVQIMSVYISAHEPRAYDKILAEGTANGTLGTTNINGVMTYQGVNQGDKPTLDPTFLTTIGGGKPAPALTGPDGKPAPPGYVYYADPATGQISLYVDSNNDGKPDYLDVLAANAGRTPLQIKNATATFSSYAANLGLDVTGNIGDLINKAAEKGWSVDRFQQQLYQTPDFQAAFPGIFNDQGGLKMTVAQYQANALAYQDAAAANGVNLSPKEQASLFSNDVSVAEAATRMAHEHTLKTNKAMFDAFNLELKAKGQPQLTKQGIFDFLGGQGNAEAVNIWNKAATDYAATQAGIKIGEGGQGRTTVPLGQLHKITSLGLSAADLASGFGQMAKALFDTVPMSEIQGKHALTASDIRQAVFGGPKQQKIQKKITRIVETAQAATQDTAHTQVSPTETGGMRTVGSNTQRAGSAY